MVKVKLTDRRIGEPGSVAELTATFARDLVAAGGAEYVTDEPKREPFPHRKGRRDKMIRTVGGTT